MREDPELIPITEDVLPRLQSFLAEKGIERSVNYLKRVLFNPFVGDEDKLCRGYIVQSKEGVIVCSQAFYPVDVYVGRRRIVAVTGAFTAAKPEFGWWLLRIMDLVFGGRQFLFSNCSANVKSFPILIKYQKRNPGPDRSQWCSFQYTSSMVRALSRVEIFLDGISPTHPKRIEFLLRCLSMIVRPVHKCKVFFRRVHCDPNFVVHREAGFSDDRFLQFWKEYLSCNEGVVSSREPRVMRWYFDDAIRTDRDVLLSVSRGHRMCGYVLLRKYEFAGAVKQDYQFGFLRYKIIDLCAIRNDDNVLRELICRAFDFACRHNGCTLEHIGGQPGQKKWLDPILTCREPMPAGTTSYKTLDAEIAKLLQGGESWFFGPYDGERCMGHGGYIDL